MNTYPDDRGVSPVVAVILMVAISVVLSAAVGALVFEMSESANDEVANSNIGLRTSANDTHVSMQVVTGTAPNLTLLVNGTEAATLTDASPGDTISAKANQYSKVTLVSGGDDGHVVSTENPFSRRTISDADSESSTPVVLVSDSFEDGTLDNWTTIRGSWTASSGGAHDGSYKLRATGTGGQDIEYNARLFPHDATINVTTLVEGGGYGDSNIYFNYKDANNYYRIKYYPAGTDNPTFSIWKTVGGTSTRLDSKSPATGEGTWVEIRIDRAANGDTTVTAYTPSTGATETLTASDSSLTGTGALRLGSYYDGVARFDNVTVIDD